MGDDDGQGRRPGRPRDAGADEAILTATAELLADVGFAGLTVDAVAARAGVGKATIYRRWTGKERLVLDALAPGRLEVNVPHTGSLRGDLLAYYEPFTDTSTQEGAIRLMPALAAEAAVNPELADQLRAFIGARRVPLTTIFDRAVTTGEVPPTADRELLCDLLSGAIMYRLYFSGASVDAATIEQIVDLVLAATSA